MELVLFLLAGFFSLAEGQSELMCPLLATFQTVSSLSFDCHLPACYEQHDLKSYQFGCNLQVGKDLIKNLPDLKS